MKALARMGAVDLVERMIPGSKKEEVHGLWEDAAATGGRPRVSINPAWHVVRTLFHELLHELHPERSEKSVRSSATRIVKKMTEQEVWVVYEEYRRRVDGAGGQVQGMRKATTTRSGHR